MKQMVWVVLFLSLGGSLPGQGREGRSIESRFEEYRPSFEDLNFFRHDWSTSLAEACSRARETGRPVAFISITNRSGPIDFFSGHC